MDTAGGVSTASAFPAQTVHFATEHLNRIAAAECEHDFTFRVLDNSPAKHTLHMYATVLANTRASRPSSRNALRMTFP